MLVSHAYYTEQGEYLELKRQDESDNSYKISWRSKLADDRFLAH